MIHMNIRNGDKYYNAKLVTTPLTMQEVLKQKYNIQGFINATTLILY